MKVYLAGPMRGYADDNGPAFQAAAARLRALGHEVWSPADADQRLGQQCSIRDYMVRDLPALLQQDAIVLLDGWTRSHGACLEAHCADVVGLARFLYAPHTEAGMVALSNLDWRWRSEGSRR